jgi:uncharacterized protein YbjT (DUF2867 family)
VFLITGARGNVGRELVAQLTDGGYPVKALVRRPEDGQALPAGAEAVVGDLNEPATFADALPGVTAIYLLAGYDNLEELLANAQAAGVQRAVLQSSSSVPGGDMDNAVARYHILSEQAIRGSGLDWTFLQPNTFMTNTLQWVDQLRTGDTVRAAFPDVAIATIDPADIAAVAVQALVRDAHAGRSYRLTGPEALRPADRVAALGRVLGRDLRFEGLSHEAARAEMSAAMPERYVDAFFSFFVDGTVDETTVYPTVDDILGRAPRSFEHWAREHAGAFTA